mgnify:CR=1 FL=1
MISLGRNGTDYTGLALLLGLGFLILKFGGFKLPEMPSVPSFQMPVFDFSGLFNGGYTPTPSYKITQKYYTPPPRTMPDWMLDLDHETEREIDLHKELTKTKGETAQWIIEKGLTPSIPNGSKVKDLHKEMESLKEETGVWIAKRPELYLGRQTRR